MQQIPLEFKVENFEVNLEVFYLKSIWISIHSTRPHKLCGPKKRSAFNRRILGKSLHPGRVGIEIGVSRGRKGIDPSDVIGFQHPFWYNVASMIDPLLATKLFLPTARSNLVRRPRLVERLNVGLKSGQRLTLIAAPAGYGKTTLLAEWINTKDEGGGQKDEKTYSVDPSCFSPPPSGVAWLSLDAQDNNAPRFWSYVIAAFQTIPKTNLGPQTLQALEAAPVFDSQTLLTFLLNDVTVLDHEIILVLDDYHVISNPAIHADMTFLIEHLPQQLHLVIATRSDPFLPLSRLRARGQLTELRMDDLRFTAEETAAFLNEVMNLDLTVRDVLALEARTEGWIVGLQLAALSLQGRSDRSALVRTFSGSHRHILDYLGDEVLAQQSEAIQQFLLQTCILERLSGSLCDAVLNASASQAILEHLEQANLFLVPLDDERKWYRYHPLFADLLRVKLAQTCPDRIPALHRRAAQWHEANGNASEAVRYALAIPDYAYASRMVADYGRRIYHQGHLRKLVEWLQALPAEFIRQSPPLSIAYSWTLFARGDVDGIPPYLDEATNAYQQMVAAGTLPITHPEFNIAMQQVSLLKAVVARHHGDVATALDEIEQVIPLVPEFRARLGARVADTGLTACNLQMGLTYVVAGDWKQAEEYLTRVSAPAWACGNFSALAQATFELARLRLRQGRLSEAEAICREELSLAEQPAYADYPAFCLIHLALADVLRAQKRWDEASTHLQRGLETAQRTGHILYLAHGYLIAARLHHAQGNAADAQQDCRRAEQVAATISNPTLNQAIAQVKQEITSAPAAQAPHIQSLLEPLSERELQVLRLLALGKTNHEIAQQLIVASGTVKAHAASIYRKLDVTNRTEAVARARQLGLLP